MPTRERLKYRCDFDFGALQNLLIGIDDFHPETHKGFLEFFLPDYGVYIQAYPTGTLLISFDNLTEKRKTEVEYVLHLLLDPGDESPLDLVCEKHILGPEALEKKWDAAIRVLVHRKVNDTLNEGREWIDLTELDQVHEEVRREEMRQMVGDLFDDTDIRLWRQFLKEKHRDIWTFVKDQRNVHMPKGIRKEFQEYKKELKRKRLSAEESSD